jgi:hypothetical protein
MKPLASSSGRFSGGNTCTGTVGAVTCLADRITVSPAAATLGLHSASTLEIAINGVNPNTDNGAGSSLLLTLGYAPQAGQAFTLLNNTSATAIGARVACGDRTSATYGGETYPFSINYAGRDGAGLVLTALSTQRGILIKFY